MVTDQSIGLRFDIYERVQLSEEVEGIEQLDEIELIPQIQLMTQGEQAVLKGNLLLTGSYLGGQDLRSSRSLEHSIPVEITLPMNRIHDLEDIGVGIENFDVELLSPRSLNVTGVLSLRGVEMQNSDTEQWSEEEEIVFVHQADEESPADAEKQDASDEKMGWKTLEAPAVEAEAVGEDAFETEAKSSSLSEAVDLPAAEEADEEEAILESRNEEAESVETEVEQNEMKIAFNSKQMNVEAEDKQPPNLKSLLHNQEQETNVVEDTDGIEISDEMVSQDNPAVEKSANAEMEWKNLFLSREAEREEQQFSKMRMCIVQKQETLDTIAERYSLNPREILLYNRLGDQDLSEGQIIYIPS